MLQANHGYCSTPHNLCINIEWPRAFNPSQTSWSCSDRKVHSWQDSQRNSQHTYIHLSAVPHTAHRTPHTAHHTPSCSRRSSHRASLPWSRVSLHRILIPNHVIHSIKLYRSLRIELPYLYCVAYSVILSTNYTPSVNSRAGTALKYMYFVQVQLFACLWRISWTPSLCYFIIISSQVNNIACITVYVCVTAINSKYIGQKVYRKFITYISPVTRAFIGI